MELEIILKKDSLKGAVLTLKRPDGSLTWSRLKPNLEYHDLGHIAIEKTLGLKKSFFGLVAQGFNIQDFALPNDQKPEFLRTKNLPPEAIVTEHMVNLLTVVKFNSQIDDYGSELRSILESKKLPYPEGLDATMVAQLFSKYEQVLEQWTALEEQQEYRLNFQL